MNRRTILKLLAAIPVVPMKAIEGIGNSDWQCVYDSGWMEIPCRSKITIEKLIQQRFEELIRVRILTM